MKTLLAELKDISTTICIVSLLFVAGCSSTLSYQEAMDKNRKNMGTMDALQDAQFIVDAVSFNLTETALNTLAVEKGYSSDLVKFAKESLEEHEDLAKELAKIARKKKIKIPSQVKSEHQTMLDDLRDASRTDFDAKFVDLVEELIDDNSDLYSAKASAAYDADIRAFAARKLDLFRKNSEEISKVEEQLLETHR